MKNAAHSSTAVWTTNLAAFKAKYMFIIAKLRLVMDVGGMSVSISGIHRETFKVAAEDYEKCRRAILNIDKTI